MSVSKSRQAQQRRAVAAQQQNAGTDATGGNPVMSYITSIAEESDYVVSHPLGSIANGLSAFAALVTGNHVAFNNAFNRFAGLVQTGYIGPTKTWVMRQIQAVQQTENLDAELLYHLIITQIAILRRRVNNGLASERHYRMLGDKAAEKYALMQARLVHQTVEREAVSGYRQGFSGRTALIGKVADFLASHSPEVSGLVSDVSSAVLDLIGAEDPLARLALGFVLREVIDRLGVDRATGIFLRDLVLPLLGDPRPNGLAAVIGDISARLGTLESQQAQFYADGGSDILQAGQEWQEITSPLADVALLAWFGQAAGDPAGWAREIADLASPVTDGIADIASVIREGI